MATFEMLGESFSFIIRLQVMTGKKMGEKMAVQNSGGKKLKTFNYCHIGQTKQKRDSL